MASLWILPKIKWKINANPFQILPENTKWGNTSKKASISLIPNPDKDSTRNLQANIPDGYRCRNSQQSISKSNLTVH